MYFIDWNRKDVKNCSREILVGGEHSRKYGVPAAFCYRHFLMTEICFTILLFELMTILPFGWKNKLQDISLCILQDAKVV